jgi:hypothetical protein
MNGGVVCRRLQVGPKVKIDDTSLALRNRVGDLFHRLMRGLLRAIPIRPRLEVGLEDRLQDELERALDHAVADGRDREDSDIAAIILRDRLPPTPQGRYEREISASRSDWRNPSTPLASIASNVTPSIPGAPLFAFAAAYAVRSVSRLHTWTYSPQNRQDGSAFALA